MGRACRSATERVSPSTVTVTASATSSPTTTMLSAVAARKARLQAQSQSATPTETTPRQSPSPPPPTRAVKPASKRKPSAQDAAPQSERHAVTMAILLHINRACGSVVQVMCQIVPHLIRFAFVAERYFSIVLGFCSIIVISVA